MPALHAALQRPGRAGRVVLDRHDGVQQVLYKDAANALRGKLFWKAVRHAGWQGRAVRLQPQCRRVRLVVPGSQAVREP